MAGKPIVCTILLVPALGCALVAQFHLPGTGRSAGDSTPASQNPPPTQSQSQSPTRSPIQVQANPPTAFDYYILSLSWAPSFCADAAQAKAYPKECAAGRDINFVVHGLWPESEAHNSPESCVKTKPVSKPLVNEMLPYMLTPALVQHEWSTHGTCSGAAPAGYFTGIMEARAATQIPVQFTSMTDPAMESPGYIETQFENANSDFPPGAFRVSCRGDELAEVRVCFDRNFKPRECPARLPDCTSASLRIRPPR